MLFSVKNNSYGNDSVPIKCGVVHARNMKNLEFDRGWEGLPTNLFLNSFIFIVSEYLSCYQPDIK